MRAPSVGKQQNRALSKIAPVQRGGGCGATGARPATTGAITFMALSRFAFEPFCASRARRTHNAIGRANINRYGPYQISRYIFNGLVPDISFRVSDNSSDLVVHVRGEWAVLPPRRTGTRVVAGRHAFDSRLG
ncbi:hypothetical protein EVAR_103493_1 [Eumeta japonica]|uniref:Uncharacterized protein n=1 Tax=Eumeta variegata TaxID=151549 RepID=A0A4C1ZJS2_EUMVA|nr:hypothetical protein EVAR_103493_1 [Eumeta japonica]